MTTSLITTGTSLQILKKAVSNVIFSRKCVMGPVKSVVVLDCKFWDEKSFSKH